MRNFFTSYSSSSNSIASIFRHVPILNHLFSSGLSQHNCCGSRFSAGMPTEDQPLMRYNPDELTTLSKIGRGLKKYGGATFNLVGYAIPVCLVMAILGARGGMGDKSFDDLSKSEIAYAIWLGLSSLALNLPFSYSYSQKMYLTFLEKYEDWRQGFYASVASFAVSCVLGGMTAAAGFETARLSMQGLLPAGYEALAWAVVLLFSWNTVTTRALAIDRFILSAYVNSRNLLYVCTNNPASQLINFLYDVSIRFPQYGSQTIYHAKNLWAELGLESDVESGSVEEMSLPVMERGIDLKTFYNKFYEKVNGDIERGKLASRKHCTSVEVGYWLLTAASTVSAAFLASFSLPLWLQLSEDGWNAIHPGLGKQVGLTFTSALVNVVTYFDFIRKLLPGFYDLVNKPKALRLKHSLARRLSTILVYYLGFGVIAYYSGTGMGKTADYMNEQSKKNPEQFSVLLKLIYNATNSLAHGYTKLYKSFNSELYFRILAALVNLSGAAPGYEKVLRQVMPESVANWFPGIFGTTPNNLNILKKKVQELPNSLIADISNKDDGYFAEFESNERYYKMGSIN